MIDRLNAVLTDRYLVERELGEGGMATVYLAEDVRHDRKVALKVLKPELAAVVGGERFLAEIETTARLQHPNILPLFDSGEADGFLFYVMPYVEGESLRDRLDREKQLPVEEAVRVATEVAEALHSAHQHGVIHRDIKPANIMLSQGRPLVADFGIALAVSTAGGHRLTETGLSLGTPLYMSPEQATGDQVVGPASDVYSLGCVLYEILVGEPPYTGSTAQAILAKVITTDPKSVSAQRRAVPLHVDAVVARALEKLPADRFSSALDVARALGDDSFRHGAKARGASAAARSRVLAAAGWGAAAVLGGLLLVSTFDADPPPTVRRLSLALLAQDGPSEWFGFTPDGSALVISDGRGRAGRSLFVRRMDDMVRTPILGSEGAIDPAVSPDGQTVAWGAPDGLYTTPLAGGLRRTVADGVTPWGLRWSDDGSIYYTSVQGGVYRVLSTGGESELVLMDEAGGVVGYYKPLADGTRGIFEVAGDPYRIEMVDVDSGERVVLTEGRRPFVTATGYLVFAREGGGIYAASLDAERMELTSSPVLLVEGVDMQNDPSFTLSDSGDLAYWTSGGEVRDVMELIWVDRTGEVTAVDTTWTGEFESVELSPTGTRAAVTVGFFDATEIWIKELDGGPAQRLTNYRGMNRRPVWSPDGTSLAFISDRGGRRAAYTVPVDAIGTPEILLEHEGKDVDEVFWSADGDWLIYRTGTSPGGRDVYARRLRPDTATIVVSAQPEIDERAPVLSPDGRWVAYISDQTGGDEVWVRPFPDVQRGSRQVSVDVGFSPVWSRTGDELFFGARAGFSSVTVDDGPDFFMGGPERLFSNRIATLNTLYRTYAYDDRSDRFLRIRRFRREEIQAELILVQNWIEEVKARVGN
jgi:eukaryotic-like serine/threonine-protein kinase